jgi:putative endonuclease
MAEHKSKYNLSTKKFSDIQLIFSEQFKLRGLAERREKQIKGWSIAKKQALISGDFDKLKQLSKPRNIIYR